LRQRDGQRNASRSVLTSWCNRIRPRAQFIVAPPGKAAGRSDMAVALQPANSDVRRAWPETRLFVRQTALANIVW
jgi:hypothetical protein